MIDVWFADFDDEDLNLLIIQFKQMLGVDQWDLIEVTLKAVDGSPKDKANAIVLALASIIKGDLTW